MVCDQWGMKPSEVINLNEDPYTEFCFNEAVAYAITLHRNKKMEEKKSDNSANNDSKSGDTALSFMTKDKYKAD